MSDEHERTASLMTPAKLAQLAQQKPRPAASTDEAPDMDEADAHAARLGELGAQLEAHASERDCAPLAGALRRFFEVLPQLDFALLEPKGWLARATGKARTAGVEFAGQFDRIVQAGAGLKQEVAAFARQQQTERVGTDRTLVEFEVEWRAVERAQEQGARWLQDMRAQLKERQAAGPDEEGLRRIKDDAARCEELLARVKGLRATSTAAQGVHQLGQAVSERRGALLQAAQQLAAQELKAWETRLAPIASAAGDSGSTSLSLEGPLEAHRDLRESVDRAISDCARLQEQEAQLAQALAAFRGGLRSRA
jgi:hypothetical protein